MTSCIASMMSCRPHPPLTQCSRPYNGLKSCIKGVWLELDVWVEYIGLFLFRRPRSSAVRLRRVVVLHHALHVWVRWIVCHLAMIPHLALDFVRFLVNVSDLVLNLWASSGQHLVGTMEEIWFATILGEANESQELLQFYDSEFCKISLREEGRKEGRGL